ncbi:MAG: methyltransferase domain-containing protein [Anaerolineae bacterium]|jgi:SAM-dependent methyltransferase
MQEPAATTLDTISPALRDALDGWRLPEGEIDLSKAIDRMVRPALARGVLGSGSATAIVGGAHYHLGGRQDTDELAALAGLTAADRVVDVCCFIGGPAAHLAATLGCHVTGVDCDVRSIAAARRIAALCGLEDRLAFDVADAAHMPYADGQFTVVWCQGSLNHDEAWLNEFDRVLAPGGCLALTFAIRGPDPDDDAPRWTLDDVAARVRAMGYILCHVEDITERDITLGWEALGQALDEDEDEFTALLGPEWGVKARARFRREIETMRAGRWGNGRLVVVKHGEARRR